MEVLHTALDVTDMESQLDFYTELLGLEVTQEAEMDGQRMVWVGGDEGGELQFLEADEHAAPAGIDHLAVEVADTDEKVEELVLDYGSEVLVGPMDHADARIAFVTDPDGYGVELIS